MAPWRMPSLRIERRHATLMMPKLPHHKQPKDQHSFRLLVNVSFWALIWKLVDHFGPTFVYCIAGLCLQWQYKCKLGEKSNQ